MSELADNPDAWPEALATVLTCRYDFGAGRALIGLPTSKHFRITYNYNAPGPDGVEALHTGTLTATRPIPRGTLFPIRYNPAVPDDHLHSYSSVSAPTPRAARLIVGVVGSLVLSLAWFAVLRGCAGR